MFASRKTQFLIVAAIAALVPAAALAADGTFDKTLHVSGSVVLSVSTGSGLSLIHIYGVNLAVSRFWVLFRVWFWFWFWRAESCAHQGWGGDPRLGR